MYFKLHLAISDIYTSIADLLLILLALFVTCITHYTGSLSCLACLAQYVCRLTTQLSPWLWSAHAGCLLLLPFIQCFVSAITAWPSCSFVFNTCYSHLRAEGSPDKGGGYMSYYSYPPGWRGRLTLYNRLCQKAFLRKEMISGTFGHILNALLHRAKRSSGNKNYTDQLAKGIMARHCWQETKKTTLVAPISRRSGHLGGLEAAASTSMVASFLRKRLHF